MSPDAAAAALAAIQPHGAQPGSDTRYGVTGARLVRVQGSRETPHKLDAALAAALQ